MVRPDRAEHAWERLCARKRDEIERDTRLLSEQQKERCERAERLLSVAAVGSQLGRQAVELAPLLAERRRQPRRVPVPATVNTTPSNIQGK